MTPTESKPTFTDDQLREWAEEWGDTVWVTDKQATRSALASALLFERSRPRSTVHHGHRACTNEEHDPANGKLSGYCVVCGTGWPCETEQRWIEAIFSQFKGNR